jgi:hypothetical protein
MVAGRCCLSVLPSPHEPELPCRLRGRPCRAEDMAADGVGAPLEERAQGHKRMGPPLVVGEKPRPGFRVEVAVFPVELAPRRAPQIEHGLRHDG